MLEDGSLGLDQLLLVVEVLGFGATLTVEKLLIPIKPMPVVEAVALKSCTSTAVQAGGISTVFPGSVIFLTKSSMISSPEQG